MRREGGREGGRGRKEKAEEVTPSEGATGVSCSLCFELGGDGFSIKVPTDHAPHTGYQAHNCRECMQVGHTSHPSLTHSHTHTHTRTC